MSKYGWSLLVRQEMDPNTEASEDINAINESNFNTPNAHIDTTSVETKSFDSSLSFSSYRQRQQHPVKPTHT